MYFERVASLVDNGKIYFYPTMQYTLAKTFVKFLDGHELIYMANVLPGKPHCCLYDGIDEVPLKDKDIDIVEKFFNNLMQFKFVHTCG